MKILSKFILLFTILNTNIFSQIELGINMRQLSEKFPEITFYKIKAWEDPTQTNIKYFTADFEYLEYFYMTDSLENINTCMFKMNKFRLPSLIKTYNEHYKLIKENELWEYQLDIKNYVRVSIEKHDNDPSNDFFIVFSSFPENHINTKK
jgi:hypothetical protein